MNEHEQKTVTKTVRFLYLSCYSSLQVFRFERPCFCHQGNSLFYLIAHVPHQHTVHAAVRKIIYRPFLKRPLPILNHLQFTAQLANSLITQLEKV